MLIVYHIKIYLSHKFSTVKIYTWLVLFDNDSVKNSIDTLPFYQKLYNIYEDEVIADKISEINAFFNTNFDGKIIKDNNILIAHDVLRYALGFDPKTLFFLKKIEDFIHTIDGQLVCYNNSSLGGIYMPERYKIFISHAKKDKPLIDKIVDDLLICGLGLKNDEVFCTSIEGLGIEVGADWRNKIRETLIESDVIILIITPNFQASEVCLYEMGAAWASNAEVIPTVLTPISFKTMSTVFNVKQGISLDEENALDQLCQKLKNSLNLDVNIGRLGAKKRETEVAIERYLKETTFESPITRENLQSLEKKGKEQSEIIDYYISENENCKEYIQRLEKLKDKDDLIQARLDCETNIIEVFKAKAEVVKRELTKVNRAVRTIIFSDYSKTELPQFDRYNNQEYCNECLEAKQSGFITQLDKIDYAKKNINKIREALNVFANYLSQLKPSEYNELNDYYENIDMDMNSKDFWEEVFGISLHRI